MPYHQAFVRLRSKPTGDWLVHPDTRDRLVDQAVAEGTSLTDLVTRILSERFGVPYEPIGRRSNPSRDDEDVLNMRLPLQVWQAVGAVANATNRRHNDVIREALCSYYGLSLPSAAVAA